MVTEKMADLTPEERQANIDRMIVAWKNRKELLEQESQQMRATPEYQAALEELEKRRIARGSRTVKV